MSGMPAFIVCTNLGKKKERKRGNVLQRHMGEASFEWKNFDCKNVWPLQTSTEPWEKKRKTRKKVRDPNKDASHRINSAWLYSLRHKNTAGGHNQIAVWWERDAEKRLTVSEELKQASVKLHWHKLERNTRGLNTQHGEINKEQVKVTRVGQSEQKETNKNAGRKKKKCKVRQHMWAQKP